MPSAGPIQVGPIQERDRRVQIDDIEQLMAATDATVERVMGNVAKITKRARQAGHSRQPQPVDALAVGLNFGNNDHSSVESKPL